MKKYIHILFIFTLILSCGQNQDKVERIFEDGVEITVNNLEPYQIGDRSAFRLEEIFKIDTEDEEISNLGIPDIFGFEVNSLGEIFILRTITGEGNFIFKFDENGKYIKSFGPQGQGPGEFQNPHHIAMDKEDNILILDFGKRTLLKYDKDGIFRKDYKKWLGTSISSGPGANFLVLSKSLDQENGKLVHSSSLSLLNPDLEVLQAIDELKVEMTIPGKIRALEPLFYWSTSGENIYIANEKRGYEIGIYDSKGKPIRKIRKEFTQMPVSRNFKEKFLKQIPEDMRDMLYFPEYYPPYQSVTAGDDGTLLVMTYEEGKNPGEFMCDVFNESGVFIVRKSVNIWVWEGHLWAKMIGDKFYCLQEKENGYKELMVYKMKWE